MDFSYITTKVSDATFGLFAGYIDDNATVTNVTAGGKLRLGEVLLAQAMGYELNLFANGKTDGITVTPITLEIYGKAHSNLYQYSFDPSNVVVDQTTWDITLDYSKKNIDNRIENESTIIDTYEK